MTDRWLVIRVPKALLVLTVGELLRALPPDLLVRAIRRGKRLKRRRRFEMEPNTGKERESHA